MEQVPGAIPTTADEQVEVSIEDRKTFEAFDSDYDKAMMAFVRIRRLYEFCDAKQMTDKKQRLKVALDSAKQRLSQVRKRIRTWRENHPQEYRILFNEGLDQIFADLRRGLAEVPTEEDAN